ncbi:MAG: ZIP family metal transporter [Cellulosilyticaceae bacterium]
MEALGAGGLAFVAEGLGVLIGIVLLYLFHIEDKRLIGMLFGCTSGIMIAMICFDILPEAMHMGNQKLVLLGVGAGVLGGVLLEDISQDIVSRMAIKKRDKLGTGIILLIGIAMHNIPEGFALGTLALTSPDTVLQFAVIICLHSIPEAIAIAIPLKLAKVKKRNLFFIPVMLGAVMGVGAVLGYLMSQIATGLIAFALGSAAGVILYIVCDELLPESRKVWNGRMTSIATVIGIVMGMLLVYG